MAVHSLMRQSGNKSLEQSDFVAEMHVREIAAQHHVSVEFHWWFLISEDTVAM